MFSIQPYRFLFVLCVGLAVSEAGAQSLPSFHLAAGYVRVFESTHSPYWTHAYPISLGIAYPLSTSLDIGVQGHYLRPLRNDHKLGVNLPAGVGFSSTADFGSAEIGVVELSLRAWLRPKRIGLFLQLGVGWEKSHFGPVSVTIFYRDPVSGITTSSTGPSSLTQLNWAPVYSLALGFSMLELGPTRLILIAGLQVPSKPLSPRAPIQLALEYSP